jgi:hypothetical protein
VTDGRQRQNLIRGKRISREKVRLPKRSDKGRYNDQALRGVKLVAERY